MANLLSTTVNGSLLALNNGVTNAYTTASNGRLFLGSSAQNDYSIYTHMENFGGNYTKLTLDWHTGIKIGASQSYGGIRFYSDSITNGGVRLFSVGEGDNNVRVTNNLYLGSASGWLTDLLNAKQNASTAITTSNWSSYAAPRAYVNDSYVEFTIEGDANTYYPVRIHNWNGGYSWQRFSIHRNYADTAPWDPIGTGVHRGGLTFTFEWAGDSAWGGNDQSIRVIEFNETYTSIVAGMQLSHCEGVVVWLRGGGAYYRLHGPGGRSQTYTINMSTWTSCAGVQYSPRDYDGGRVNSEINSRYPIRGSGNGNIFVNNQAVIHSGNIGSQSVSSASTVTHFSARTDSEWYNVIWGAGSPSHMYSSDSVRIRSSDGALRANIYYDNQDTTYYGDFAGTSWLRHLSVGDVNAANDGGWNARLNLTGSSHARLDVKSNSDGIITTMYSHTGQGVGRVGTWSNHPLAFMVNGGIAGYAYANYLQGVDSLRAPIFYDSNDTGYYLDPNGGSNLNDVTANQFYANGWFRNYGAQGIYNQSYGTHFYSNSGSSWAITGSGGNVELQFRSNHQSTIRGYVYADTGNNIGFLNNGGGWAFRTTFDNNALIYGSDLTIGVNGALATNIIMGDGDEGSRTIHCNSNRIGFLTQGGSWGSWCSDDGSWNTAGGLLVAGNTTWFTGSGGQIALENIGDFARFAFNGLDFYDWQYGISMTISGGDVTANNSFRAPIFYDSQDTGYFVDPNATSNLNTVNAINFRPSNAIYFGGGNNYFNWTNSRIYSNVGIQSASDMLAPIFYDSQDTTYYLDPNNTLLGLKIAGNIDMYARSASWAEGIRVRVPSTSTWGGIRFTRDRGNDDGNWAIGFTGIDSTDDLTFWGNTGGTGAMRMRLDQASNLITYGSMRAPVFYDSDNTGFYLDPANSGTSLNMNGRMVGNSWTTYGRNYCNEWIEFGNYTGLYSPLNGAHFYPNNGTFGSWRIAGSRNGYAGLEFDSSNGQVVLMVNTSSNLTGFHNNSYGWHFRWENGTLYCHKNTYGGGTAATVLDSSNYSSWAQPASTAINTSNIGSQSVNYATSAGSSSSSSRSSALDIVGYGSGNMTYYQSPGTFAGYSGWAGYFVSNHGDGATYYNQTIIMPFWSAPQYSRLQGGGAIVGPYTFWTTENLNDYAPNMNQYVRTSDNVTFNTTTAPTILVNNHSDNTKGYRIHNTSGSSVSAMFTNSSNALVIAAGAVDQINLNKKVYVNGVALGVNVTPSSTAGRIDASNDIVAYSSSDERLKYNISPIENAIDKVKSLTGVEFDWKPEYKHAHGYEGHDTGIIAQQVQEIIPSAVRTNDTGFLAVRYEKLIGLLVEGMKEQQAQIEELKAKLDGLTK